MSRYKRRCRFWRRVTPLVLACFVWSSLLALPAQALASRPPRPSGRVRPLTPDEMRAITGAQAHPLTFSAQSGPALPWEGGLGGVATVNGNKLTPVPIVHWTARGGLPVEFTLFHNSLGNHNGELGQKWTFTYDLYLVVDGPTGNVTIHFGHDSAAQYTRNIDGSYTPPVGIHDTLVANGNPITSYDLTTARGQVRFRFTNPNGTGFHCASINDLNGNTITINRNTNNYVTSIVDPTNRTITLGYDGSNRITSITDPLGRQWTIEYNASNQLTRINWPLVNGNAHNAQFGYNGNHCITSHTDRRGNNWTFDYNSDGSLKWLKDPLLNQISFSYTETQTTITDPNGKVAKHNYNTTNWRLTSVVDPLNYTESYTYDASNNITRVTDRRGNHWDFTYDSQGNILTAKNPLLKTTTFTYNSFNQALTVTTPLNHQTSFTYDPQGRLLTVTDPLNHTFTHTYDGNGLRLSTTDALNHTTHYGYDTHGNLTSITDANNNVVSFAYNALGRRTSATDGRSITTTYAHDNWNRVTSVTRAGVTLVTIAYDPNDNVTSMTDGNNHATTGTYDASNRLTSRTNGRGDVVTYTYDATGKKGLLASKTNGNNRTTTYTYTARNELSGAAYPDSTAESWTYDANGSLASHTDGKGQTVSYTYDTANRLTLIDYPTGTDTTFTYDDSGRRTGMTDASGTTTWNFDAANRLASIIHPNGTVTYAYDNANRRTDRTLSGTGTWTYSYDNGNRLTSLRNPFNKTSRFSYDAANRLTQLTHGNGAVTLYGYDDLNRPTDVWHKKSGGAMLGRYQYQYDGAGNVTQRTDNDGAVTTFTYDGANQLTGEQRTVVSPYTITYTYDNNGNRLSKTLGGVTETYTYDFNDKLLTAGNKTYQYDLNGNCTAVTSGGQTTSLIYNAANRVTQITYPGGATNTFLYNGLGLRVQKVDGGGTKNYVTDGTRVASPVLKEGSTVYTPGLAEKRGSTHKYYHGDALGSTRGITKGDQAVTDGVLYDAFGLVMSRTGTTPTPFLFVGSQQYQSDSDSGLLLLGHRYYDPSIGRFLRPDPIGHGENWYAYVGNNPLTRTDPTGLIPPDMLFDGAMLGLSLRDFWQDPSFLNGLGVLGDGVGFFLPMVPALGKPIQWIGGKVGEIGRRIGEGFRGAWDWLKGKWDDFWGGSDGYTFAIGPQANLMEFARGMDARSMFDRPGFGLNSDWQNWVLDQMEYADELYVDLRGVDLEAIRGSELDALLAGGTEWEMWHLLNDPGRFQNKPIYFLIPGDALP